jgi:chromate transporter
MLFLELFYSFFKIGLFSFGGGYAMIPLIQREIETHQWISTQDYINIISISEMTPGPIAVNTATFVGYKAGGIFGGFLATFGVVLPSLILILIASYFFNKFKDHPLLKSLLWGIKPVVVALIVGATIFVARNTLFRDLSALTEIFTIEVFQGINLAGVGIFVVSLVMLRFRVHPILVIIIAASSGIGLNLLNIS